MVSNSALPYVADKPATSDPGDDSFDLDALLADSLQAKEDAKRLQKEGKRVKESIEKTQRSREYASDNARSALYGQLAREWVPVAAVAMFHTQRCVACGTNHTHFMGVFQRQIKQNGGISGTVHAEQWVRATDHTMIDGLTKEQKITDEPVDMCECCAPSLGYPPLLFA